YQKMVATLRNAGIRAELYLGNPKNNVGQQLKYADRRNSPCAVIQGGDEKLKNEVQIKDLILGGGLAAIKDRDEYLKKQAEAQFASDAAARWKQPVDSEDQAVIERTAERTAEPRNARASPSRFRSAGQTRKFRI